MLGGIISLLLVTVMLLSASPSSPKGSTPKPVVHQAAAQQGDSWGIVILIVAAVLMGLAVMRLVWAVINAPPPKKEDVVKYETQKEEYQRKWEEYRRLRDEYETQRKKNHGLPPKDLPKPTQPDIPTPPSTAEKLKPVAVIVVTAIILYLYHVCSSTVEMPFWTTTGASGVLVIAIFVLYISGLYPKHEDKEDTGGGDYPRYAWGRGWYYDRSGLTGDRDDGSILGGMMGDGHDLDGDGEDDFDFDGDND